MRYVSLANCRHQTYILADKLCMEVFANKLMDLLRESYKQFGVTGAEIILVMEKGNAQLRDLVLLVAASAIISEGWDNYMSNRSSHGGIPSPRQAESGRSGHCIDRQATSYIPSMGRRFSRTSTGY
jgi:hypothetical protein